MAGNGEHVLELKIEVDGWFGVYRVPVTAGKRAMVDLQVPAQHGDVRFREVQHSRDEDSRSGDTRRVPVGER